jgi:hypothetical protein
MAEKKGITAALLDLMDSDAPPARKGPPKPGTRMLPAAFPDYGKSLVSQEKSSPGVSGLGQGLTYGALGAVLGAVLGKLTDQDRKKMLLLSALGGALGGGAGFYSGKKQRESDNSRLFFLRRMGVSTPGELEAMSEYPGLVRKLTDEGYEP